MVAVGRASTALALVAAGSLAGLTVLERRRLAPVLWAGVAFTAPLQGVRAAPILALSDILLVAALVAILPDVLIGWRRLMPAGVTLAFGLLITAGLIGTFFAQDVGASLANLVKIVLASAGSVVAMALWDPGPARLHRFAWLWFGGACTSAAWAAVTPRTFVGRSVGLTTHPNHFGLVCVLGVGLGLGLALSSSGRARLAAVSGVVLLTAGIGLSGSRSALLGLAFTIGLAAILTRRLRLLVATGAAIAIASMAVIVGMIHVPETHALSRLGGGGGSAGSDAERAQALTGAWSSIGRHPFTGEGFQFAQAAHSIYLQVLVVGGPLALLSFLWVSWLIMRTGLRAAQAGRDERNASIAAGLVSGYAGYLASGTFENILWDRYLWTYIGLLLVVAASARRWASAAEILGGEVRRHGARSPHQIGATQGRRSAEADRPPFQGEGADEGAATSISRSIRPRATRPPEPRGQRLPPPRPAGDGAAQLAGVDDLDLLPVRPELPGPVNPPSGRR